MATFAPIDYSTQVAQPFGMAALGYAQGALMRDDQAQQRALIQQREAQAAINAQVQSLLANPRAGLQDFQQLAALMPKDQSEQLMGFWSGRSTDQQQAQIGHMGRVFSALAAEQPDVAKSELEQHATAARNSGREAEAQHAEAIARTIGINPAAARVMVGKTLSMIPGGEKIFDALKKQSEAETEDATREGKVREGNANADKAEQDASKAKSDAIIKAEEAKVAPQTVALTVKKLAAEVGLTNAQTQQAVATAKKLRAEAAKALAELEAGGDPMKNFDAELKLRKEYDSQTKNYQDTVEAYRRVQAASDDGPGDIALIYGYMKMLDPGSVVREGEFATASNSGGIPTAIQNLYNKALSGQRLTPGQRKTFTGQAGKLADAASKREAEVRNGLMTVARSYKLNPDNIFGAGVQRDAPAAPAPAPGAAPVTATNPQTGQKLQLVNGQWVPVR